MTTSAFATVDQQRVTIHFGSSVVESLRQFDYMMSDVINANEYVTINSYRTAWLDAYGADVTFYSETPCSSEDWSNFSSYIKKSF